MPRQTVPVKAGKVHLPESKLVMVKVCSMALESSLKFTVSGFAVSTISKCGIESGMTSHLVRLFVLSGRGALIVSFICSPIKISFLSVMVCSVWQKANCIKKEKQVVNPARITFQCFFLLVMYSFLMGCSLGVVRCSAFRKISFYSSQTVNEQRPTVNHSLTFF